MYNIKEETTLKVMAECLRLGKLHYTEVYKDKEGQVPMNYNWEFLKICFDNNLIHVVTARVGEELVGYFVNLVNPDLLSSTFLARELAIFVHEDHRRGGVYSEMLKVMENLLRDNGVTTQYLGFQVGHNDKLPLKNGYKLREYIYEKILLGDE